MAKAIFKLAEYYLEKDTKKGLKLMKLLTNEQLKQNNLCDKAAHYYGQIGDNDTSLKLWKVYYSQLYEINPYKIHIDRVYQYCDLRQHVKAIEYLSM